MCPVRCPVLGVSCRNYLVRPVPCLGLEPDSLCRAIAAHRFVLYHRTLLLPPTGGDARELHVTKRIFWHLFRGRMGLCKASERRQCRTRIQGCTHHNPYRHTATFKVMQVCLTQVRPYAIKFTTARAVSIEMYYGNQSITQRASECRLNRLSCIHDSIHSAGRVR